MTTGGLHKTWTMPRGPAAEAKYPKCQLLRPSTMPHLGGNQTWAVSTAGTRNGGNEMKHADGTTPRPPPALGLTGANCKQRNWKQRGGHSPRPCLRP